MSERERKDFGELVQLDGEASMTGGEPNAGERQRGEVAGDAVWAQGPS
jgi:hypothetical protein